mgnify:CR=1 FL=1
MGLMTISEVGERLGISARMLRYYENEGMVESMRMENYAYRVYDEAAVRRIRQIILLRKLQLPLKKIRVIMDGGRQEAVRAVEEQIAEAEQDMASMRRVSAGLEKLQELLRTEGMERVSTGRVWENVIANMTGLLPIEKYQLKGSAGSPVSEKEKHIRIVLLPPCTVASYQHFGINPEEQVGNVMDGFIRRERLYERKPDSRLFGFNPPGEAADGGGYGYGNWVTIPDDMEVPAPFARKHFPGGLYAAYGIQFPDFQEWEVLKNWGENNERYRTRCPGDGEDDWGHCLEEHLNWVYSAHAGWPGNGIDGSVDLLLPIQLR